MYNIVEIKEDNTEPWVLPFPERVKRLFDAKKQNQKIAMYLYECADTSTFRYRVYNVSQSLELSLFWKSVYFFRDELEKINKYIELIDILVVARFRWDLQLKKTIDLAHRNHKKVVFDIDDMVFNLEYLPIIVNTLSVGMKDEADYNYWFAYISRLQCAAKECDGYISTNHFLSGLLEKDLNRKAYIIPNYTNRIQEKVSYNYYEQKQTRFARKEEFIIGYFSGTPSHINDFMVIAPAMKRILDKYPGIILRIVGFMELPDFLIDYENRGRIQRRPLVNFIELQKEIAEVDVNVAPLVNNQFSNCKSELKFFEASIVGTITCATPTFTFRENITDGENGFLCKPEQWEEVIEKIYRNEDNRNNDIVLNAYRYCKEKYGYANQVTTIENVMDEIVLG